MKILLPVDGSEFSRAAVQSVISLYRPEVVQVLVLRIVEPRIYSVPPQMSAGYAPELEEVLKEDLQRARESVTQIGDMLRSAHFNVDTRVVEAEARNGILDVAAEWRADLIILGSHGRKGLERFMMGSVAESVARHADCSVQIVRLNHKQ